MMYSDSELSKKIVFLSFVMSLLVVLWHSSAVLHDRTFLKGFLFYGFNLISVPAFFVFSGYWCYLKMDSYWIMLKKKIKSIVIPFVFFVSFYYFFSLFISLIFPNEVDTPNNLLKNYFLEFLYLKKSGVLWYLRSLFFLFLISPILFRIVRLNFLCFPVILGMLMLFTINLNINLIQEDNKFVFNLMFFNSAYSITPFLLGMFFAKFNLLRYVIINKWLAALAGLVWLLGIIYFNYCLINHISCCLIYENIAILFGLLFVWIIYDLFLRSFKSHEIYKYSFMIYLLHGSIVGYGRTMLSKITGNVYFVFFTTLLLGVFMSIVISCILKKYTPKLWGVISGGRT